MRLSVLDLDGSLTWQAPVRRRVAEGRAEILDFRDLGRALRLWAWERDFDRFARRLPAASGEGPRVFMVGSGDYHHLTAAILETVRVPVTVVHFDNHPDWAWTFPRRHCGSWVNEALGMPRVARVVTLGCCSEDLTRPDRAGINLLALRTKRLVMLPWQTPPTPLGKRAGPVPGHAVADDRLHWTTLAGATAPEIMARLAPEIETDAVWITLDKDVLGQGEAATNWDQGGMPLDTVEAVIGDLASRHRIHGVDICGDFSAARHRNPMKWTEALLDQPRQPPASLAVNESTNERLLSLLERVL
ncbi:arginase [uncultured Alsobacter sp.]|uniref:arginase n=1 Tax=uncultured Alsobacter sp. TaxID=1748258 RepID=UPI0025E3DB1E|nr:arginase [uncultured Alsobacter sp.]